MKRTLLLAVLLSLTALCTKAQTPELYNYNIQQQMNYLNNCIQNLPNVQFNFDFSNMPVTTAPLPIQNTTPAVNNNNSNTSKSKPQQTGHDLANKRMDETTYEGYATMLMNMCYGNSTYNDSNRLSYQKSMRDIRMKWVNKGYPFTQSSWETWSGVRK